MQNCAIQVKHDRSVNVFSAYCAKIKVHTLNITCFFENIVSKIIRRGSDNW